MLKAFLINLNRATGRLAYMQREFDRIDVGFTRIAAVDGASLSRQALADFVATRTSPSSEPWLPGEIGCFLSHFGVWQTIASEPEKAATVFEDDVHLATDIKPLLESSNWMPADADLVRLEASRKLHLRGGRRISAAPKRRLYRALSGTWGSAGYILTKEAAGRLVRSAPELHRAVDVFLFKPGRSPMAHALARYQVVPAVCIQDQVYASSLGELSTMIGTENRTPATIRRWPGLARLLPWKKQPVPFRH